MTELGYPTDERRAAARLSDASADDAVFVAVATTGVVVGFAHAAECRLLVSDRFVEMEALIVTAAARRHGAAAALVAAVEGWTVARGVAELRVRARIERDVAHSFYLGRGFAVAKQQRLLIKRLGPA
jgi:GNAT superfamily N-acetyltransferase